jgi:Rab-3A-interacting protein
MYFMNSVCTRNSGICLLSLSVNGSCAERTSEDVASSNGDTPSCNGLTNGDGDKRQLDEDDDHLANDWDRTLAGVKEQAFARLQEELSKAHQELRLRDEEVNRLSRIREEVEAELEELTASLFQVHVYSALKFTFLSLYGGGYEN